MPLVILFLAEQFDLWQRRLSEEGVSRKSMIVLFSVLHAGLIIFFFTQPEVIISSYFVVLLSYLFFILICLGRLKLSDSGVAWIVFAIVLIQPVEVYSALNKNAIVGEYSYKFNLGPLDFLYPQYARWKKLPTKADLANVDKFTGKVFKKPIRQLYYACKLYSYAYQHLDFDTFDEFRL